MNEVSKHIFHLESSVGSLSAAALVSFSYSVFRSSAKRDK